MASVNIYDMNIEHNNNNYTSAALVTILLDFLEYEFDSINVRVLYVYFNTYKC